MRCSRLVLGWLALVSMLAGCSGTPVVEVVPPPEPVAAGQDLGASVQPVLSDQSVLSGMERDRILRVLALLDGADRALEARRLTEPRGSSALDYYRQVLVLLPGYEEAQQGLKTIVDRYIEWSDAAMRQGRSGQAQSYLAKARRVDADDPDITQAAQRLRALGRRDGGYVRLDARELGVRSSDLVLVLGRLADRIRAQDARVVIQAPTDAQGRWIYQQLNQRHENFRIRANLRLDAQPGIRLLY